MRGKMLWLSAVLLLGAGSLILRQRPSFKYRPSDAEPAGSTSVLARSSHGQALVAQAMDPQIVAAQGNLPLSFEANRGQTDTRVKFLPAAMALACS